MIVQNLQIVKDRISEKCASIGRDISEIKLIAVSKNFGIEEINEAFNDGVRDFGENKAQELEGKFEELGDKITWHFIGNLQKNKVKYVVKSAEFIHSVASLSLAEEIDKRAEKLNKNQKILIQVKTSDEETKSGVTDEKEVIELVFACNELANVSPIGLMTIAPFTNNKNLIRQSFSYLRNLKEKLKAEGFSLKELSMGMTSDFEIAIEEGATMLRIGSAIFGQRDYSKKWKEL
jgi:pyridoxal phosphate enzyme (YggS family)